MISNIPEVKVGIIAVSRRNFPITLSERRRHAVAELTPYLYESLITVGKEEDVPKALDDVRSHGCNALVVFLGNFGPETPETLLAARFDGPVMFAAAAEGDGDLIQGRGDAFCGLLNCSYNIGLRNIKNAYIPEIPVGDSRAVSKMIDEFIPIARAVIGLKHLKIISFGPRPRDFFACNAPIKGLYDIGVEIEENSELDLYVSYQNHADDKRIADLTKEMEKEIDADKNPYREILPRLAQYELTLRDWAEEHKGIKKYVTYANKCWPAFCHVFEFEPCYVNSRLSESGIPVGCECDIYGALSEYIGLCTIGKPVTLIDINNTVTPDKSDKIALNEQCKPTDLFMGFHCGNTPCSLLRNPHLSYHIIQKREFEPNTEPRITRGTMAGDIKASDVTIYRLQADAYGKLHAYVAEGAVVDFPTDSYGSIGIFRIPEMERFYRYVLLARQFPHHTAVAFSHTGDALYELFKYYRIPTEFNHPSFERYDDENPFR